MCRDRNDHRARQASHVGNPLRIGGVAIMAALSLSLLAHGWIAGFGFSLMWVLSVLPVLVAGLLEDLGYRVSAWRRFFAALSSALLAVVLLGVWAPRGDIPGVDLLMQIPAAAIVVTIIFSAVFCHATNLVDGMNGLATVVVIASALGLAAIAQQAGATDVAWAVFLLALSAAGFLIVNWPRALLFLGDAGAYGLGHLLVWAAIMLAWRSEEVAIPALLLTLFWPIADVLHTVLRRFAIRAPVFRPDRMHLHHKIRRMLELLIFGCQGRAWSNPLTTLLMVPMICAPVLAGVLLWTEPSLAWAAMAGYLALFLLAHHVVLMIGLRSRSGVGRALSEGCKAFVLRRARSHGENMPSPEKRDISSEVRAYPANTKTKGQAR